MCYKAFKPSVNVLHPTINLTYSPLWHEKTEIAACCTGWWNPLCTGLRETTRASPGNNGRSCFLNLQSGSRRAICRQVHVQTPRQLVSFWGHVLDYTLYIVVIVNYACFSRSAASHDSFNLLGDGGSGDGCLAIFKCIMHRCNERISVFLTEVILTARCCSSL